MIAAGLVFVVLLFGGFGTWALTADLSSAVLASGLVTVDGKRKQVQHPEGGTVKELLVRDGDVVAEGEALVLLDETRPQAVYRITQASHDAAPMRQARLVTERDGLESVPLPPTFAERLEEQEIGEIEAGTEAETFEKTRVLCRALADWAPGQPIRQRRASRRRSPASRPLSSAIGWRADQSCGLDASFARVAAMPLAKLPCRPPALRRRGSRADASVSAGLSTKSRSR